MAGVGPCVEHPVLFASATGIVYVPGSPEALVGEPSPSSIEVSGSDDRQAQGASPTSVDQADVVAPAKNPPELVDADMDAVSQPVEVVRAEEVMRIDFNEMLRECLRTSEYLEGYKKKSELPPHNSLLNPQMCEADELRFVFKTPSLSRKVADISGGNWEHKDQGYLTALLKMMEAGLRATRKSHLQADGTHVSRSDDDYEHHVVVVWGIGGFACAGVYESWADAKRFVYHGGVPVPFAYWFEIEDASFGWAILDVIYGRPVTSWYSCWRMIVAFAPHVLTNLDIAMAPKYLRESGTWMSSPRSGDAHCLIVHGLEDERKEATERYDRDPRFPQLIGLKHSSLHPVLRGLSDSEFAIESFEAAPDQGSQSTRSLPPEFYHHLGNTAASGAVGGSGGASRRGSIGGASSLPKVTPEKKR